MPAHMPAHRVLYVACARNKLIAMRRSRLHDSCDVLTQPRPEAAVARGCLAN
jgi:hypothetical protein